MGTSARSPASRVRIALQRSCLALALAGAAFLPGQEGAAKAQGADGQRPSAQQAVGEETPAARQVRYLSGNCTTCHGFQGRPVADAMPQLAGQPAARLVEQFRAYRDGTREGTIMNQIAKGYSDADIEALASYFSLQEASR